MNKWIMSLLLLAAVSSSFSAQAQTLLAGDPEDDRGDDSGLFFDLTATNNVTIESFGLYSGSNTGNLAEITIYARSGSWVGFDTSAAGWTVIGSYSRSNNDFNDLDAFLLDTPLVIAAGQTAGIYIFSDTGGIQHTDNCSEETFSDASLSLTTDLGDDTGAFPPAGVTDDCMNFAGTVTYTVTAPSPSAAVSVPAIPIYGLMLTTLGLLLVAIRRLRMPAKRN
jgi:hypothetical protein